MEYAEKIWYTSVIFTIPLWVFVMLCISFETFKDEVLEKFLKAVVLTALIHMAIGSIVFGYLALTKVW